MEFEVEIRRIAIDKRELTAMATSTASFCTSPNISALLMTIFLPAVATAGGFRSSDTDFTIRFPWMLLFASLLISSGSSSPISGTDWVVGFSTTPASFFASRNLELLYPLSENCKRGSWFLRIWEDERFNSFWNLLQLLKSVSNGAVGEISSPVQLAIRRRF